MDRRRRIERCGRARERERSVMRNRSSGGDPTAQTTFCGIDKLPTIPNIEFPYLKHLGLGWVSEEKTRRGKKGISVMDYARSRRTPSKQLS